MNLDEVTKLEHLQEVHALHCYHRVLLANGTSNVLPVDLGAPDEVLGGQFLLDEAKGAVA